MKKSHNGFTIQKYREYTQGSFSGKILSFLCAVMAIVFVGGFITHALAHDIPGALTHVPMMAITGAAGYLPANANPAVKLRSGKSIASTKVVPDSTQFEQLTFTLTADGTWATTTVILLPQKTTDAIPAHLAWSSDQWSSFADFQEYVLNQKLMLGNLLVSTNDTDNFTLYGVKFTKRRSSGVSEGSYTRPWSQQVNEMAQLQTIRRYPNTKWVTGHRGMRYELSGIKTSTYMTFTWDILGEDVAVDLQDYVMNLN